MGEFEGEADGFGVGLLYTSVIFNKLLIAIPVVLLTVIDVFDGTAVTVVETLVPYTVEPTVTPDVEFTEKVSEVTALVTLTYVTSPVIV